MKIILASKSPRRKELMDLLKIDYEIIVSNAEEKIEENLSIEDQSKKLSFLKAKAVFDKVKGDKIVIGSDTIVVKDGIIYGKPKDREEAIKMIKTLENDKHDVVTGLAILIEENGKYEEYLDSIKSEVYLSKISEEEILEWVDSGKAYDKAGAYAIQLEFSKFIEKINGNYNAIVGLPLNIVYKRLKEYI